MKLIIGLGNPGEKYERTRHNAGFRVVDRFAAKHRLRFDHHEKDARVAKGRVAGQAVMLAKPETFMNRSGEAVEKLVRAYIDSLAEMLVIYDEIDLPLGRLRIRESGSSGTHNGMRSVIERLASNDFPRLRFGIRGESYTADSDLRKYVLDDFTAEEEESLVTPAVARAADALVLFVRDELRRAMNEFNREEKVTAAS